MATKTNVLNDDLKELCQKIHSQIKDQESYDNAVDEYIINKNMFYGSQIDLIFGIDSPYRDFMRQRLKTRGHFLNKKKD